MEKARIEVENLIFHQDNAPGQHAKHTLLTVDSVGFERLEHRPHLPGLAPMGFMVVEKRASWATFLVSD